MNLGAPRGPVPRLAVAFWATLVLSALLEAPVRALTLDEAIDLALRGNERVSAADERSRAAGARVARARAFFFPDLTLSGDYTRRSHETTRTVDGVVTTLQTRDGLEGRIDLEQTLVDAGAIPLLQQARRLRAAAREDEADVKRNVAFEAARAFLAVLNGEQVARAASQRLELASRSLEEVRVRFGAQLVSSNDVTRIELERASAERELARATGAARTARLELGYLLNAEVADSLVVPTGLLEDASAPVGTADTYAAALDQRPDVRAETFRVSALRASAKEPLMRYFPDVTLTGTAWSTNEAGFSQRDRDWSLGLGLNWPIFDGGDREAEGSERRALARAAEMSLANLKRGVEIDIEVARVSVESEQASLARAHVAVEAARRNAEETAELYRQGLVRALESVDANVQLFVAEVERAGAQVALATAYLDYRAASGLGPLRRGLDP